MAPSLCPICGSLGGAIPKVTRPAKDSRPRWTIRRTPAAILAHATHLDSMPGRVFHEERLDGRGACDMKGGLAASIIAVEALIDSGIDLPGAIEISGTVDEESGGYGGVAYLAERGCFSKPRVDHVIIPEPLNVDRVCIGHRGVWWAEIETQGRIAHGSMPFLGDSAIRHMGAVLEKFEHSFIRRSPRAIPTCRWCRRARVTRP